MSDFFFYLIILNEIVETVLQKTLYANYLSFFSLQNATFFDFTFKDDFYNSKAVILTLKILIGIFNSVMTV